MQSHSRARRFLGGVSLLVLLLVSASGALAQQGTSLELIPLLTNLLDTDESVQAAQAAYESVLLQVDAARGGWLPKVDLAAEGGYEQIQYSKGQPGTDKLRNQETLTIKQLIYDFGSTGSTIRVYEAMSNEALASLEQARQIALYKGVSAYLTLIRYREMLKYLDQSERSMKELSGIQEALVRRGSGISPDELRVKAQLASVMGEKLRAEQQYRRALHNFKAVFNREITNAEVDTLVLPRLPGSFLPGSEAAAVDFALETNPTLLQLMQAVERSKHIVNIHEAKFYPTFELVSESQRKEQDQSAEGVRTEQRVTVQMTYNLYDGGADLDSVRSAKKDVTSAKKTVLDKRDSVEEGVRNAWSDMLIVLEQAKQYENQTNITFEYLSQLKRIQAAGGDVDLTTILIGEKDYISATSAMVTTQIDHIIAAYTLLFQMGNLTPKSVQM